MRLSLNHWPPLASHFTALLLGIAVSNISLSKKLQDEKLARGMMAITISGKHLWGDYRRDYEPGLPLVLVQWHEKTKKAQCVQTVEKLHLLSFYPHPVVAFPKRHYRNFTKLWQSGDKLKIASTKLFKQLPPCRKRSRVSYR